MIYKFIDNKGTFVVESPHKYNLYLPLTNKDGTILSSISPNLAGDIKKNNDCFLTPPASIEDLRSNLLVRRDFFIKVNNQEIIRCSYPYRDKVEIGLLYQKLIKDTTFLKIEILNFVPWCLDVEIMQIKLEAKKDTEIVPTSFIPLYGRKEANLRDHRHVSSLLNRIFLTKYGILLKPTMIFDEKGHQENKIIYFVLGYENQKKSPLGQFPTLDYFYGEGDLINPQAITQNIKPLTKKLPSFDGKEVCASFRFKKRKLKKGQKVIYTLVMGITEDKNKIKKIFQKVDSPDKVSQLLIETQNFWLKNLKKLEFDFKDKNFNNWLLWVKLQPTLRKLFGCSFLPHFDYGKGGRGWRDLWQDILTLILLDDKDVKTLIENNFKGVRIDGSNATIITKEGNFLSDRNRINRVWMDHGIWPYLSLRLYLNKTSDLDILLKEVPYFCDHQLKRAKEINYYFSQKDYLLKDNNKRIYYGTILEHLLIQHLVQFFNVGEHNYIRLENADWNDGLDMAPKRGESIVFTFMYAHNLKDLCMVLEKLKGKQKKVSLLKEINLLLDRINHPVNYQSYKEKQKRLEEYLERVKNIEGKKIEIKIDNLIFDLKEKANHLFKELQEAYLKEGFFNGYFDEKGRRVEGIFGKKVRMMLPTSVFSIMSGVANDEQIKRIWALVKKYLKDKKLGGFHLNTNFGSLYLDLGRAFGFSYGDKENGAFFSHMVVMFAYALYKRGFVKEGFEVLNSIYKMATSWEAKIYPMIPEYFNLEGRGLYFYLTGSASWYIYTLLEQALGIKFLWGDLLIEPKLTRGNFFKDFIEVKFLWRGKMLRVTFFKERKKISKIKKVLLENQEIFPQNQKFLIKEDKIKSFNKKEIALKVFLS
jgi:cellobiose phosphorylase